MLMWSMNVDYPMVSYGILIYSLGILGCRTQLEAPHPHPKRVPSRKFTMVPGGALVLLANLPWI